MTLANWLYTTSLGYIVPLECFLLDSPLFEHQSYPEIMSLCVAKIQILLSIFQAYSGP